jgi:hypothetical protein
MRIEMLMYVMLLPVTGGFVSNVMAQNSKALTYEDSIRIDSLVNAYHAQERKADNEQATKKQRRNDSENLSELKANSDEARAKAKEAQRVTREANDAARQARMAYRTEKKAQKVRKQADRQARKAAKAQIISDKN